MENSINSFLAAYEAGADFVELDIQLTKDNNIVVYHDDNTCIVFSSKLTTGETKKKKKLKNLDETIESQNYTNEIEIITSESFDKNTDNDDADSGSTTDSVSSLNVSIRHLNMNQLKTQKASPN